ncbi:hypothetical protein LTR39_002744, partial [Cryomyces antarcticus]
HSLLQATFPTLIQTVLPRQALRLPREPAAATSRVASRRRAETTSCWLPGAHDAPHHFHGEQDTRQDRHQESATKDRISAHERTERYGHREARELTSAAGSDRTQRGRKRRGRTRHRRSGRRGTGRGQQQHTRWHLAKRGM